MLGTRQGAGSLCHPRAVGLRVGSAFTSGPGPGAEEETGRGRTDGHRVCLSPRMWYLRASLVHGAVSGESGCGLWQSWAASSARLRDPGVGAQSGLGRGLPRPFPLPHGALRRGLPCLWPPLLTSCARPAVFWLEDASVLGAHLGWRPHVPGPPWEPASRFPLQTGISRGRGREKSTLEPASPPQPSDTDTGSVCFTPHPQTSLKCKDFGLGLKDRDSLKEAPLVP